MTTFKDTEIGPIPADWQVATISDLGHVVTGATPSTKVPEYYGGAFRLISPSDLGEQKYVQTAHKWITEAGLTAARELAKDTVLVGCIGNVGKTGMTFDDRSASNQQINAITCGSHADPHFVYYLLTHSRPRLEDRAAKVTVPILNKSNFERIPIPLPPLPEQRRIAHVLSTIQQAIATQDALIAAARQLKRSLMHRLFTYGPGPEPAPTKETEIGEIPEGWEICSLGQVASITMGQSPRSSTYNTDGEGSPFLQGKAEFGHVHPEPVKWCSQPKKVAVQGSVLVSVRAPVGDVNIAEEEYCIGRGLAAIDGHEELHNSFLFYLLIHSKRRMEEEGTGSTFKSINRAVLDQFSLPLPPRPEQRRIAQTMDTVQRVIAAEQQRKAALQALFKSMLHQLMTGQIRVSNLHPAEEETIERKEPAGSGPCTPSP